MLSHFKFCPKCGQPLPAPAAPIRLECAACGFVYYFNPAVSAAAIILNARGEALFIRRAKEPAKDKLALPGGFIDFNEIAEDALRREIREEVNLALGDVQYLCSYPNHYDYRGVTYTVLDLFFVARVDDPAPAAALDDVQSLSWLRPEKVPLAGLAFDSMRHALQTFLLPNLAAPVPAKGPPAP
ncbi:MAG: NUDIX hydrolase [Verrucomicrobiota bacterium]